MSHTKKNKTRDLEAQKFDPPESRLVTKFLEMDETDYARNVVIPVLEAEGYKKIDFHHGQTEVGKDLILYREIGLGRKILAVAVIKSDKLSKTASSENGLPVLLIQIDQARSNEVLAWDGSKRKPDEVLVILADDPSHDILTANPGGYIERIQNGLSLIHGSTIAELLIKHRPEIAEHILQSELNSVKYLCDNPTNIPLLNALNTNETIKIESIFTNLDASIGSTSFSDALCISPNPLINHISVNEECWEQVASAFNQLELILGPVLLQDLDKSRLELEKSNTKSNSTKNKELLIDIQKYSLTVHNWLNPSIATYDNHIYSANEEISKLPKTDTKRRATLNSVERVLSRIRQCLANGDEATHHLKHTRNIINSLEALGEHLEDIKISIEIARSTIKPEANSPDLIFRVFSDISRDLDNIRDFLRGFKRAHSQSRRYIPEQEYKLEINIEHLLQKNNNFINALAKKFQSTNIHDDAQFAKTLLLDTKNYLIAINNFKTTPALSNLFLFDETRRGSIGACVLSLMNSGINLVINGAAGSGKSTTLEMFARQMNSVCSKKDQVIFLPLARIGNIDLADAEHRPFDIFCETISKLFQPDQPGVTPKFVTEKIKESSNLYLIFDGIDEASHLVPWITRLIPEIANTNKKNMQFIASSRFEVAELNNLGALNLLLLPFSKDQVKKFIRDFLKNAPLLSEEVISHLNTNPSLYSVAKTPLMSTILCSLAINGVTLPETKSALYRERFELLWGTYDKSKGIKRVNSSRSVLEDVSKKVAYYLHSTSRRSASRDEISDSVIKNLGRKYGKEIIKNALLELERPCNVLVSDVDGGLSFGHLSYQEYLAGDELYTCRQSEIVSYLADPWWRGALVHVAMKAEDIGTLIVQRFMDAGDVGNAFETLEAMIEVCDGNQKNSLQQLLTDHNNLDLLKLELLDDDDDPSYYYK